MKLLNQQQPKQIGAQQRCSVPYPLLMDQDRSPQLQSQQQSKDYSIFNVIRKITENNTLIDKYPDSIRMLVLLISGEQRLVTFQLPKEACTIHEILGQVGVDVNPDVDINVAEYPPATGLNYVVTVGYPPDALTAIAYQEPKKIKSVTEELEGQAVPEQPKELPKYILALCRHCGYSNEDFNKCLRCKRKFPEDIKLVCSSVNTSQMQKKNHEIKHTFCTSNNKNSSLKSTGTVKLTRASPRIAEKKMKFEIQEIEPVMLTRSFNEEDSSTLVKKSQVKVEHEEEYISNILLKKEEESLVRHNEREEECFTNNFSRKPMPLCPEKRLIEQILKQEQEYLVKKNNLEQLRREKMELENTLEQEREALWKRIDKLEAEKRMLQIKLDQPILDPATPRDISNGDTAINLSSHIQTLCSDVARQEHTQKMQRCAQEEKCIKEENLRLQKTLQLVVERRKAFCRHLSESECSLKMEAECHHNEQVLGTCQYTVSPVSCNPSPSQSSPLCSGLKREDSSSSDSLNVGSSLCHTCGQMVPSMCDAAILHSIGSSSPPAPSQSGTSKRFIKPQYLLRNPQAQSTSISIRNNEFGSDF